ncbi:uncharacterized protein LOC115751472 isoform X2 [Rhodamnia argentea]|uniref:Uncharacterized protein LOC115751472 isoform X2 n=1 Tax=Rhodamnia argentea TaxID=178133 RepID=A0ABM3H423_9MYRT|nr:uncharacterized protein LOC115751472 isoform X2 [Rhodamnia argentea]
MDKEHSSQDANSPQAEKVRENATGAPSNNDQDKRLEDEAVMHKEDTNREENSSSETEKVEQGGVDNVDKTVQDEPSESIEAPNDVKASAKQDDQDEPSKNVEALNDVKTSAKPENDSGKDLSDKLNGQIDAESKAQAEKSDNTHKQYDAGDEKSDDGNLEHRAKEEVSQSMKETDNISEEKEAEPVFDGTEVPGMESIRSTSLRSLDLDPETQGSNWPEKAAAIKNFVMDKSADAVSTVLRRLSGKKGDDEEVATQENKEDGESCQEVKAEEASQKASEKSTWNPLSYFKFTRDADEENKAEQQEVVNDLLQPIVAKGRIILYTRLGCQECKEARLFLYRKRLRYVEINVDVYPSRKLELEKISGSSAVPKVLFNEILIGGLSEMKNLDETGKLKDKIDYLIAEAPSPEAPLPPLSGEDDASNSGAIDELAIVVRKMKESVPVKDRFSKMRRFTSCFLGSEAVNFISEDQYLEREEAIQFGRKLASKLFFYHVLDENEFEDGNHLYRFLDHDPIVSTQCYNIPRGIIDVKPKPIIEIASRLRFLSYAIFDAYTSEDGKHVDYRSIHGSEEFARYLRTVEELQRVELQGMPREEKLAFFINLYNMMAIHAILVWGHPAGALERKKLFGDFKYVVGGCTYSLSAIQNGILRGNQRPPYNLMKPFGAKDKRSKVALPYPEPLIHFALVCGTRSGPALQCYSPGNIDKELTEAACLFLRSGGFYYDPNTKVASVSKILKWFRVDFGKNEVEVLKHASNYLASQDSEALLEMLSSNQLKVTYQPYDWGANC